MVDAQPQRQFGAGHAGHDMVGDDNVGPEIGGDHAEPQFGIVDVDHVIAKVGQHFPRAMADQGIVVDQQHLALRCCDLAAIAIRHDGHRLLLLDRQPELDFRALAHFTDDFERATQLASQAMRHRQAKAGAMADRLGCEEGLGCGRLDRRGHADAGIGDAQADKLAGNQRHGEAALAPLGGNDDLPAVRHGVARIDHQVEDGQFQLMSIGAHRRHIRRGIDMENDLRADRADQQGLHILQRLGKIDRCRLQRLATAKGEQPLDQRLRGFRRLHRDIGGTGDRFGGSTTGDDLVQPADDRRQQIVEVVRDMPGQLAQHVHLLDLPQLVLRAFQFARAFAHALVQMIVQGFECAEEPAIFECGGRGPRQRFEQRNLVVGRHRRFGPIGAHGGDRVDPADRHHDHAADEGLAIGVHRHPDIVEYVGDDRSFLVQHRPAGHTGFRRKSLPGP